MVGVCGHVKIYFKPAPVQLTSSMLGIAVLAVVGFSLHKTPREDRGRELAERCAASCDSGHDRHCDQQDALGEWTESCDLHPTTSCDEDCAPLPPPPPLIPWLGAQGTHPSPPPPPPPPQENELLPWAIFALVAAFAFGCCIVCVLRARWRMNDDRDHYWWCCCVGWFDTVAPPRVEAAERPSPSETPELTRLKN